MNGWIRLLLAAMTFSGLVARGDSIADVCVYGDSPAAVTAAVELARQGKRVDVVSPGPFLGGHLIEGLGGTADINNHGFKNSVAVGGLSREFFERIGEKYEGERKFQNRFEPKVAQAVFAEWLAEENLIRVFPNSRVKEQGGVEKVDGVIRSLTTEDGSVFRAAVFIDASYEGDLLKPAGVSYTWGREANATYGETLNGIREKSDYRAFKVKVDPHVVPGDPESGLIATIQDEKLGEPGAADRSIMGFCFRMCLTRNPDNRVMIEKPAGYDPATYEIYRRYFAAGGAKHFFRPGGNVPNGKTDLGSWHDLSANLYGMNHGYPDGSYAEQAAILEQHERFTKGLIWFLQNDPSVPDQVRKNWEGIGMPKDEFVDNGHWPRKFYVRSARRMVSDYVVTEADLTEGHPKVAEDPVGVAYWPPDMHHARRIVRDGHAYNEGFVFGGSIKWRPFGVSYRALVPKRDECANLITPTCPSSTYVGYGAIRLEWTFMVLGQSAGAAGSLAVDRKTSVQDVDYADLKGLLRQGGQILELGGSEEEGNGIVVDNADKEAVTVKGDWTSSTFFKGFVGSDYLHDGEAGKGEKSVAFQAEIPEAGTWVLWGRWSGAEARSEGVPFRVQTVAETREIAVNQKLDSKGWKSLGEFELEKGEKPVVTIGTKGTTGYVIADAIRWTKR